MPLKKKQTYTSILIIHHIILKNARTASRTVNLNIIEELRQPTTNLILPWMNYNLTSKIGIILIL